MPVHAWDGWRNFLEIFFFSGCGNSIRTIWLAKVFQDLDKITQYKGLVLPWEIRSLLLGSLGQFSNGPRATFSMHLLWSSLEILTGVPSDHSQEPILRGFLLLNPIQNCLSSVLGRKETYTLPFLSNSQHYTRSSKKSLNLCLQETADATGMTDQINRILFVIFICKTLCYEMNERRFRFTFCFSWFVWLDHQWCTAGENQLILRIRVSHLEWQRLSIRTWTHENRLIISFETVFPKRIFYYFNV